MTLRGGLAAGAGALAAAAVLLAACKQGPDFLSPAPPEEKAYTADDDPTLPSADEPPSKRGPAQRVAHLFQHLRNQVTFLEGFRRALRGGRIIDRISDVRFSRSAPFAFQSGEICLEFTLFIAQQLFEVFGIHA